MTWNSTATRLIIGKRILSVLILAVLLCAGLYGYFVSTSVINILVRKEIEKKMVTLNSKVSDLEAEYLARKNELTLDYAYTRGFSTIKSKHFAVRVSSDAHGLSLNRE
jgi:hypothetical protein